MLAQVAQRAVDAPSLEVFKARLDGALGPDLVGGSPVHSTGLELDGSLRCLPTQTVPWFYDSTVNLLKPQLPVASEHSVQYYDK